MTVSMMMMIRTGSTFSLFFYILYIYEKIMWKHENCILMTPNEVQKNIVGVTIGLGKVQNPKIKTFPDLAIELRGF